MKAFLILLSLIWMTVGAMLIVRPDRTRGFLKRIYAGADLRLLSPLPFGIGLLLVAGAFFHPEMFLLPFILGLMGIAKGFYLAFRPEKIRSIQEWWFDDADRSTIRRWGFAVVAFGIGVLYHTLSR